MYHVKVERGQRFLHILLAFQKDMKQEQTDWPQSEASSTFLIPRDKYSFLPELQSHHLWEAAPQFCVERSSKTGLSLLGKEGLNQSTWKEHNQSWQSPESAILLALSFALYLFQFYGYRSNRSYYWFTCFEDRPATAFKSYLKSHLILLKCSLNIHLNLTCSFLEKFLPRSFKDVALCPSCTLIFLNCRLNLPLSSTLTKVTWTNRQISKCAGNFVYPLYSEKDSSATPARVVQSHQPLCKEVCIA